jgi:small GTP-binding protein
MTFSLLLDEGSRATLIREQEWLGRLVEVLSGWETDPADLAQLKRAGEQLEELFLLVVVGEFNSGKSALINALLGEGHLPEGVTPTTDRIHILKYGKPTGPVFVSEDVRELRFPAEFLREIHIVDTPGTNAVLRRHEALTRDFVPRSDMVIFVTSADRPFTESERSFLELIREWGKKLVLVINKCDLLEREAEIDEVEHFVRDQAERLLSFSPRVFSLSARRALRREAGAGADGFAAFQDYLRQTLTEAERVRLKLLNPAGVALKLVRKYLDAAQSRVEIVSRDARALEAVHHNLGQYEAETRDEFLRHVARVENALLEMRLRGDEFLDDRMRLWRLREMLSAPRMRQAFESRVVADTPERIGSLVQEIIDWLVEKEFRQWRWMADELGRQRETEVLRDSARGAAGSYAYNRRQLLDSLGAKAEQVIAGYDRKIEAARLAESVQESVAVAGLVEVGAIGLGLLLKAVVVGAAADLTGLLAAGALGIVGLAIIPFRRGQAKRQWRQKVEDLRARLKSVLEESFAGEMSRSVSQLSEAVAPYRSLTQNEEKKLQQIQEVLKGAQLGLTEIQTSLEEKASNPA